MVLKYFSTRNSSKKVSSVDAILKGLADDGGLYVPETIPKIDIELLEGKNYKEIALEIFKLYLTDFTDVQLKKMIDSAYSDQFDIENLVDVKKVDKQFVLELFHGPTLAFKDMALSILPYFMVEAKKIKDINEKIVILTATSGDTGKAALEGFKDVPGIEIIVFYPNEGVSDVQKLQMLTTEGTNTHVVAINGNFDDAQRSVKEAFSNRELRKLLEEDGYVFSSANSINIGRLIPQIVYYFYAYFEMVKKGGIIKGDSIKISVPTGNFGNILAAYYAKEMGLPVEKLICASNENNILTDFINTGQYDTNRDFVKTISPSMDILVSSNLERFIHQVSDGNEQLIKDKMNNLKENKKFDIEEKSVEKIKKIMIADFVTEEEILKTIKTCFEKTGYLLDPHTAVAYSVSENVGENILVVSTASPYKFGDSILKGFDTNADELSVEDINLEISKLCKISVPKSLVNISKKEIRHHRICGINEIEKTIEEILKVGDKND